MGSGLGRTVPGASPDGLSSAEAAAYWFMSALGQMQTALQKLMSALPPKADMCGAKQHVRFTPNSDRESRQAFENAPRRKRPATRDDTRKAITPLPCPPPVGQNGKRHGL